MTLILSIKVLLGNSITLTPGTLTLDVTDGRLYVHVLTNAEEQTEVIQ